MYLKRLYLLLITIMSLNSLACFNNENRIMSKNVENNLSEMKLDTATLGAGCFWCVEAIFNELEGVEDVVPGYCGGEMENPDYKSVCSGETGHVEVCQVYFDPNKISYKEILEVFWTTHDPTTLNRQGNDVGSHYRSAIFYHNDLQKRIAEESKKNFATNLWGNPIVTEISFLDKFYLAEGYHDDYYSNNSNQGYCQMVIEPKVLKFRKVFKNKLKKSNN